MMAINCGGFFDATGDGDMIPPKTAKCCADFIAISDIRSGSDLSGMYSTLKQAENGPT